MAVLFLDGMGHLSAAHILSKYDFASNYASGDVSAASTLGRFSTACYTLPNATGFVLGKVVSAQSYLGVGVHFYTANVGRNTYSFLGLFDDTTCAVATLRPADLTDGFVLYISGNATSAASLTATYTENTWNLIELEASWGSPAVIRAYLSGVLVLSYASALTNPTASAFTQVRWGGHTNVGSDRLDDLYIINNASGGLSTLASASMRIREHYGIADTATASWTPSTGASHWSMLNEASGVATGHDSNVTYISAPTAGARDLFSLAVATGVYSTFEQPKAVQLTAAAIYTSGPTNLTLIYNGSGTVRSGLACATSATYQVHTYVFNSAAANVSWTVSAIDTLLIGLDAS